MLSKAAQQTVTFLFAGLNSVVATHMPSLYWPQTVKCRLAKLVACPEMHKRILTRGECRYARNHLPALREGVQD